mmetsp:Transcript_31659/g.70401  ORF Transcript_31659/g.70401 Transcript_31659/m.70401 type:complete len:263 (-) Transcript_31659:274-1062(-)
MPPLHAAEHVPRFSFKGVVVDIWSGRQATSQFMCACALPDGVPASALPAACECAACCLPACCLLPAACPGGLCSQQLLHIADLASRVQHTLLGQRCLAGHHQPQISLKVQGIKRRLVALDRLTVAVDHELDIIPLDLAVGPGAHIGGGGQGLPGLHELIEGVCTGAVDVDLVKDVKFKSKLLEGPCSLLLRGARSLSSKLVAGESTEREPIGLVLVVQRPQAGIVHVLQRSLAGHIDHDQHLTLVLGHGDLLSIHQSRKFID